MDGGQAQATGRLSRRGTAFEHRRDQFRPQPPLDVGAGPVPQQVQRDQLRGVDEGPLVVGGQRLLDRGPHRAENLVARADPDRHPRQLGAVDLRQVHRAVGRVEGTEGALPFQLAQVPLGDLAAEDGLLARLVGAVLVIDAAEVVQCQEAAQQGRDLCPRRAAGQPEQHQPLVRDGPAHVGVDVDRDAQHQRVGRHRGRSSGSWITTLPTDRPGSPRIAPPGHDLEQRRPQIVEDTAQRGPRSQGHAQHL